MTELMMIVFQLLFVDIDKTGHGYSDRKDND